MAADSGGSFMVWGFIWAGDVGDLVKGDGIMSAQKHH